MLQTETAIHPHGEENNPKDRPSPTRGTGVVHRLRRLYVTASILLMNVLIWGILLNLAAYMVLELSAKGDVSSNPLVNRYGAAADRAFPLIYPTLSRPEIDKLLEEMWSRPVAFHPFTLFKERPYRGKYVNVHPAGFRYSENQGPWPPSRDKINIFFFGGSTAFGYGLPDSDTIPSQLQRILNAKLQSDRVRVYNFGTNSFYSSQERAYLAALLAEGHKPNFAIFLDRLNEFFYIENVPKYSEQISELLDVVVRAKPRPSPLSEFISNTPLIRLFRQIGSTGNSQAEHAREKLGNPNVLSEIEMAYFANRDVIQRVLRTYLANKAMIEGIANSFGVRTVFVWQPVPSYNFDLRRHPFPKDCKKMYSAFGYAEMRKLYEDGAVGPNFLWAADLQTSAPDPIYVDMVHYTAPFCRILAEFIANHIAQDIETSESVSLSRPSRAQ